MLFYGVPECVSLSLFKYLVSANLAASWLREDHPRVRADAF